MAVAVNMISRLWQTLFGSGSGVAVIAGVTLPCPLRSLLLVLDVSTFVVSIALWNAFRFAQVRLWLVGQQLLLLPWKRFIAILYQLGRKIPLAYSEFSTDGLRVF
jgi:hypothetical protein